MIAQFIVISLVIVLVSVVVIGVYDKMPEQQSPDYHFHNDQWHEELRKQNDYIIELLEGNSHE